MTRFFAAALAALLATTAQARDLPALKAAAVKGVEARSKLAQVMNDQIFSFGEIGFEEVETSKLITATLERNGFAVTRGIAGCTRRWRRGWRRWG